MRTVLIKQKCRTNVAHEVGCGSGCCVWLEWETENLEKGEEYDENKINFEDLIDGEDFIFIED